MPNESLLPIITRKNQVEGGVLNSPQSTLKELNRDVLIESSSIIGMKEITFEEMMFECTSPPAPEKMTLPEPLESLNKLSDAGCIDEIVSPDHSSWFCSCFKF